MLSQNLFCHLNLQQLYVENKRWLSHWFQRHLACAYQAEDLAQNTFIRVLRSSHNLQIDEPRAFLTTLAKRELYSFWRRKDIERAYLESLLYLPHATTPSEEELMVIRSALEEIDILLSGLPAKVKQAFLLNRLDGLTYKEIAKEMGFSLATIERYMRQAFIHCYHAQGKHIESGFYR